MLKRNIFIGSLLAIPLLTLGFLFFGVTKVNANPSAFIRKQSAAASTTLVFMTPGTATTTAIIDCQIGGISAWGCESGALMTQFTASSSVSTLLINQEFAQGTSGIDCVATPNLCDWYEGNQGVVNGLSTTTLTASGNAYDISGVPQYSFKFASSTVGGIGLSATNNLATRLITFQSPTRYTRFVFSLKIQANGNGAVYWDIVAKKQNN